MKKVLKSLVLMLGMLMVPVAAVGQNIYGDVNGDLEVNIADVNAVIDVILNDATILTADVNQDGEINIADINVIIDIILNGDDDDQFSVLCERASEVDYEVIQYYEQCESLDEMMQHADAIRALDDVEDVYSNGTTTMFVKIKDFFTLMYSFYPGEYEEANNQVQQRIKQIQDVISQNSNRSYGRNGLEGVKFLAVNQQTDWDWSVQSAATACSIFDELGFESDVKPSPNVEFFTDGIFDCDYLFIITHGCYDINADIHWLSTSVPVERNFLGKIKKSFLEKYKNYGADEVAFEVENIYTGEAGPIENKSRVKVSEHLIKNKSTRQFRHPGKAVVFNVACQSMKGPTKTDSIHTGLAQAFIDRGACVYFGYDEAIVSGQVAGLEFWHRLAMGLTISDAINHLTPWLYHEYHDYHEGEWANYWADLTMHPKDTNFPIYVTQPVISYEDKSNDNILQIDLKATGLYTSHIQATSLNTWELLNDYSTLSQWGIDYGFELCEDDQFNEGVSVVDEKHCGEQGQSLNYLDYSCPLTYSPSDPDSKIKPGTTYWARAYMSFGDGYNYSEPITFTTGSIAGETPETETFSIGGVSFTMVTVEGGTFTMGDTNGDGWDGERPAHQVTLSSFAIGQTEVTQSLWKAVMGNNPSYFNSDLSHPVEQISWNDCQQFISELNTITGRKFRLPTDAEWEFAARGGVKSNNYYYSGSDLINDVGWYDGNSNNMTHSVASKAPNELGLYDMSGNVWEWCQDWFGDYSSDYQTNPTGPEYGTTRVMRSGSYDFSDYYCRVAHRNRDSPERKSSHLGMRLVLDDVFSVSQSVVDLYVGEETAVSILNGSGQYSVTGGTGIVTSRIEGNTLFLSGISLGSATLIITDLLNGGKIRLLVTVTLNKTFTVNGVSFTMIPVEGGTFLMGARDDDSEANTNERPAHQVTLSSYMIGQTEVTRALWFAVMGSTPNDYLGDLDLPKTWVTWSACQSFITKLNGMTGKQFRLPTEAEWEFAARGGNKSLGYKFSGSNNINVVAWYRENAYYVSDDGVRPVATKAPNELGLYDMTGNVREWVNDWWGPYGSSAETNPSGPVSGSYRIDRGGSWRDYDYDCRISAREGYGNGYSFDHIGFRIVLQ